MVVDGHDIEPSGRLETCMELIHSGWLEGRLEA